jgi:NADH:ubiquinone oxidoreductase subunit 6 (subunit J)
MILQFFDYSLVFLLLFFILLFIIVTSKIINVIISFMLSSCLISLIFLRLNYEYLGFIYLIFYFGAVLMLFLFVVMLLDIENVLFSYDIYINTNISFLFCLLIKFYFMASTFLAIYKVNDYALVPFALDNFYSNCILNFSIFEIFLIFFNFY